MQEEKMHRSTYRVLKIFELLSATSEGMSLTGLAQKLEIPKGSLHPILKTMQAMNFIRMNDNGNYTIGQAAYFVGSSYTKNSDLLQEIDYVLKNLSSAVNQTAYFSVLSGGEVLYLLEERVATPITIQAKRGYKYPAYATGIGKALLSGKTEKDIKTLYPEGLYKLTEHTIDDFDTLDYIDVVGDVTTFAGAMQLNIKRVRKASEGEYNPADYLPVSENSTDDMYGQILNMIKTVKNEYLSALLNKLFVEDKEFLKSFQEHSAAKTVHHGFIGGLMEHTLSVTKLCDYMANAYPLLKRDLLITASLLHDVGKTKELSSFPLNDYTDEGQLLGHIIIGAQMIHDLAKEIPNFPETLENQLVHCILAHHGELEYGSPKKPALAEAVALNLADNTDARMETLTEIFAADKGKKEWLGYNRLFESNLRRTGDV